MYFLPNILSPHPHSALDFLSHTMIIFLQRQVGDPLRVYMDLEAGRKKSGYEDMFISYHAEDDVQSTYAGALFHNNRNYHLSSIKNNVSALILEIILLGRFQFTPQNHTAHTFEKI